MRPWIIPSLLFVGNFILKGIYLATNSLAGDEPYSVYHAQMDLVPLVEYLSTGNNPPLYEIFLHFWIDKFGISEFAVRFPSLIFSSITILFIYRLCKIYLNIRIAIYASLFFIVSNYQLSFAHEARVYALLGMLSIISMYFFLGILHSKEKKAIRRNLILLIVVNAMLIYSHYFGFFILLVQVIYLIIQPKLLKIHWKQFLIAAGALFLLYLPNLIVLFTRVSDYGDRTSYWLQTPNGLESIYNMLWKFSNAPIVTVSVIIILIAALIRLVINRKDQKEVMPATKLIVLWFTFIFFGMFLLSYQIPMFHDRYLMPAAIAFPLLLAISVDTIFQTSWYKYVIPSALFILFALTFKPYLSNNRLVRETVADVNSKKGENTLVLILPRSFALNFAYYYDPQIFQSTDSRGSFTPVNDALRYHNITGINSITEFDVVPWHHIIFVDASNGYGKVQNDILEQISEDRNMISKSHFEEYFEVWEYDRVP